jgi:nitroreductase
MAGIQFHRTQDLKGVVDFYRDAVGMQVWLQQKDCIILKHGNFLLGFCEREEKDNSGIITFFYGDRSQVDEMYRKLEHRATDKPVKNDKYNIYQFFARDPEDRLVEFQCFLHPLDTYIDGEAMLQSRRSIRSFTDQPVTDDVLWKVFELCRYSPTSRNSQSYSFTVIREPAKLDWLAGVRGSNSAPINRAHLAVAITSDPRKSKRYVQDGCIAAYHFLLSAWLYGLGTCWIAAMDREDVKDALHIPQDHYIATVTPVGYPAESPAPPERRPKDEMVRII